MKTAQGCVILRVLLPEGGDGAVSEQAIKDFVEEKFPQENFRVVSEMRILGKNRVAILDFGRVCRFFSEIWREIEF